MANFFVPSLLKVAQMTKPIIVVKVPCKLFHMKGNSNFLTSNFLVAYETNLHIWVRWVTQVCNTF